MDITWAITLGAVTETITEVSGDS